MYSDQSVVSKELSPSTIDGVDFPFGLVEDNMHEHLAIEHLALGQLASPLGGLQGYLAHKKQPHPTTLSYE